MSDNDDRAGWLRVDVLDDDVKVRRAAVLAWMESPTRETTDAMYAAIERRDGGWWMPDGSIDRGEAGRMALAAWMAWARHGEGRG